MSYNIFGRTAPAMPKPSKGTDFVKFAISQASKDIQEVLIPMVIPALSAHFTDVEFMCSDNKYYEMCGQMGHFRPLRRANTEIFRTRISRIPRIFPGCKTHTNLVFKKSSELFAYKRTPSHAIPRVEKKYFVSLHRDWESAPD